MESSWSRRTFLAAAGATAAGAVLASCSRTARSIPASHGGARFAQPKELRSRNGTLRVDLRAAATHVPYGTGTRFAYTYNGSTPGPTLRVRPGDTLVVTLRNDLDEPTNLHTHGLHVSPGGSSDNVFVTVAPGAAHTYTYEIPDDHRSGTFWYHPHHHGMVAPQLSAGLFGAIVVADAIDDQTELASASERILVLSDPRIGADSSVLQVSGMDAMQGREGDATLVNGLLQPTLAASTGRLEHWRVINASPSRYHRLVVAGHELHLIATDGGRLAAPATLGEVLLAPGERAEVLVQPKPGIHAVRALPYDRGRAGMGMGMGGAGGGSSAEQLATLQVASGPGTATLPDRLADPTTLALPAATGTRQVRLAMGMGGSGGGGGMGGGGMMGGGGGGGGMMSFTIDGRSFDPTRTDLAVGAGAVEEWTIINSSPMDHPFHLHVWPFQVTDPDPGTAAGWKDTVNVPANSSVRIRVPFTDLTGRTVYHCHILDHEDQGMMGTIEVT